MSSRTRSGGTFRSLGVRNYRNYFFGSLAGNTGMWMQRTAQFWLVLELTGGSAVALGITTFLQFAPTIALSLYAGMLADRMEKQKLLAITQAAMGLAALVLGLLDWTGVVELWHVYFLAGVLGAASAIDAPPRQAFASELVGRELLPNAVSLNSASFNAARLVGPALAGITIAAFGTAPTFIMQTVTSVLIVMVLLRLDTSALERSAPVRRAPGQMREGFRYVRARLDLMLTIALASIVSLFGMTIQVFIPLMAREVFDQGAAGFGMLTSAMAIGTLGGALMSARRSGMPRQRWLIGSAIGFGALLLLLAAMPDHITFGLLLVPAGAMSMGFMLAANTNIQLGVDPDVRGRVMSLYMLFFMGGNAGGSLLVGWLSDGFGIRWALALCGILTALGGVVVGALLARHSGGVRVRAHIRRPHFEFDVGRRTPEIADPAAAPAAGPAADSAAESSRDPIRESTAESGTESASESAAESGADSTAETRRR